MTEENRKRNSDKILVTVDQYGDAHNAMRKKEIGELVIDRKEKNSVKSINLSIKAKNEESRKETKDYYALCRNE